MKKKLLIILLSLCVAITSAFTLSACRGKNNINGGNVDNGGGSSTTTTDDGKTDNKDNSATDGGKTDGGKTDDGKTDDGDENTERKATKGLEFAFIDNETT